MILWHTCFEFLIFLYFKLCFIVYSRFFGHFAEVQRLENLPDFENNTSLSLKNRAE